MMIAPETCPDRAIYRGDESAKDGGAIIQEGRKTLYMGKTTHRKWNVMLEFMQLQR